MSASLVYQWRLGLLSTVAAGRTFQLPTYRSRSSIDAWQKVQELRPGNVTLWDHCFELPHARGKAGERSIPGGVAVGPVIHRIGIEAAGTEKLETYDYPGGSAQRFDGVNPGEERAAHHHPGTAVYVGGNRGGTHIHGWPPYNLTMCVVVMQQWDELFAAIAEEKEVRFSIEP